MRTDIISRCFAAWLVASLCFPWAGLSKAASPTAIREVVPVPDPSLAMVTALRASRPHPSLGDQANLIGRLVGIWNVQLTNFSKDGKTTHRSGQFIAGWVLDGRVIQDLWIVEPSGKRKDREVYTDLRWYDPKSETWLSMFIDPEDAAVARFTSSAGSNNQIVFDTPDFEGADTRWSINDIRPDTFVWREEESLDGGKTWQLSAEYHMKRQGATPPAP